MTARYAFLFSCCSYFLFWLPDDVRAAEWPQFLGSNRDGTTSENLLMDRLPIGGPEVVWKVTAGEGMGAVAVSDGVAYATWNTGNEQVLIACDAKNGAERWQVVLGKKYENSMGNGPRATPTVSDGTVFAYTGDGVLHAVDTASGKPVWRLDLIKACKTSPSEYGMSSSPLVSDGQVIVHVGGDGCAVVSADAKSGEIRWTAGSGPAGYSSPAFAELHGRRHVISFTGSELLGIGIDNGDVLWSYPFETDYACNTASPVIVGDSIFISSGENHGCVLLDVEKTADGFGVKERWESTFSKSVMRNEWQTSIVINGYLYGFDNVGAAGPTTHLSCIELATGKPVWRAARFGKGNMVLADGKLWITTMDGELVVANPDPSGYKELGRAKMYDSTRQTMSIANGLGYIRDTNQLLCVKLVKE